MPRKGWNRLSDQEWLKIKAAYEADPTHPSCDELGQTYGIDGSTVNKRAKAESWRRLDGLALATIKRVENANTAIIEATAANVTEQLTKHLSDTLQPWIEREKVKHIRTQVKRSKLALKQLDAHIDTALTLTPKDSSFIAKTADTWDNIMRRNLGMSDGAAPAGSLTLNVLTNHAAVQVKQ